MESPPGERRIARRRRDSVKRRDAILGLFGAAVLLALLSVFAIELSNTQAKSKRDVETRVHERGVLAAALVDGLFQTVQQQIPQDVRLYGGRTVSTQTLERQRQTNLYISVLDGSGRVIAASRGFTAEARANLSRSVALELIHSGHPYGLCRLLLYRKTGLINV